MLSKKDQKFIKSLKVKKYRTREKSFLVEGSKNVQELLKSEFKTELIVGTEEYFGSNLKTTSIRQEVVDSKLLTELSTFQTNEDVLAVAKTKSYSFADLSFEDHVFVLDEVRDPGNLGTIIRTLDWFASTEDFAILTFKSEPGRTKAGSTSFVGPKTMQCTSGARRKRTLERSLTSSETSFFFDSRFLF